ncbi:MAG: response regulator [Flavobacteriia bacterium]|nr:response regulator [Flavobacteriia bacterium]
MKILICEDELIIAEFIKETCIETGFTVCGIAKNSIEAIEKLHIEKPDVVLLDINLDERMSGVRIGEYIAQKTGQPFIFITAFSDMETLEAAIKTNPQAYLIKPIDKPTLVANLQLALYKLNNKTEKADSFLDIPLESENVTINVSKLVHVEASGNYCELNSDDSKPLLLRISISVLEELLKETHVRIHKSHIVNPKFIVRSSSLKVSLRDNKSLPIGRKYKENLAEFLQR